MNKNIRTFGDLFATRNYRTQGRCAFCKNYRFDVLRYSTRHCVCDECGKARAHVILPAVLKRERFERRLAAIHARNK